MISRTRAQVNRRKTKRFLKPLVQDEVIFTALGISPSFFASENFTGISEVQFPYLTDLKKCAGVLPHARFFHTCFLLDGPSVF